MDTNLKKKRCFYSKKEKEKYLEEFQSRKAGQSMTAFCKEKGINFQTFTCWLYRDRKAQSSNNRIAVTKEIKELSASQSNEINISINGVEIKTDKNGISFLMEAILNVRH